MTLSIILSNRDIRAIVESLQESSFHWQAGAQKAARCAEICSANPELAEMHRREQKRLERVVKRRQEVLARLQKAAADAKGDVGIE